MSTIHNYQPEGLARCHLVCGSHSCWGLSWAPTCLTGVLSSCLKAKGPFRVGVSWRLHRLHAYRQVSLCSMASVDEWLVSLATWGMILKYCQPQRQLFQHCGYSAGDVFWSLSSMLALTLLWGDVGVPEEGLSDKGILRLRGFLEALIPTS